jgi:hypothetical protein
METTEQKKLEIDPDSGMPVGSIIKNYYGEYGMIAYRKVVRLTKEQAEELIRVGRGESK